MPVGPNFFVERRVGRSKGQIGLLCQTSGFGVVFDVANYSPPTLELERIIRVTDVPKNVCNIEPVDRDRLRELRNGIHTAVFATELRLFELMIRETDTICWYSTVVRSLSGSAGFAIVPIGKSANAEDRKTCRNKNTILSKDLKIAERRIDMNSSIH